MNKHAMELIKPLIEIIGAVFLLYILWLIIKALFIK